jgi:hypothetical protein
MCVWGSVLKVLTASKAKKIAQRIICATAVSYYCNAGSMFAASCDGCKLLQRFKGIQRDLLLCCQ